jgi:hypothetical protein
VTGLGLPAGFAGLAFFRGVGRSGAFLTAFFRDALTFLTLFLRAPLLTGVFLRRALFLRPVLALPFAFFLVAIAAS